MHFLSALPALIWCLVHFSLTTCKPLESNLEQNLTQELHKVSPETYKGFLLYAIPAASSGKNLFQMQQSVSEDCVKTANAITQAFFRPSTMSKAILVISQSINETVEHRTPASTFHSQMEMLCHHINEEAKKSSEHLLDFEDSKKKFQIPRPAKNYILETPNGQILDERNHSAIMPFDDPQMFKFQVLITVQKFRNMDSAADENQREPVIVSKAISELARKTFYPTAMDNVFKEALDYSINTSKQKDDKVRPEQVASPFLKRVDQDFLNNDSQKEKYSKIRKEVKDQLPLKPKFQQ